MSQIAVLFLLVLGGILLIPLAERLRVPAPVLTTVLGLVIGLIPQLPNLDIPPDLILPLLLPPLLYAAARRSSWQEFRANIKPILVLAVVLVFVTTGVIALVAATVHPLLPVGAAVVLGAVVSPPDAAAVTTIASRLGLPRRMVTILEGEGLFNDVTALTLYQVAVAGVVAGSIAPLRAVVSFAYAGVMAVVVGAGIGLVARLLFRHLSDSRLTTALSLLIPYMAYLPADELGGSGVLAVLVTAFVVSGRTADPDDIQGRLVRGSFWDVTELMVTAVTFGFIGLELVDVFRTLGSQAGSLLWKAVLTAAAVIAVRMLWMTLAYLFSRSRLLWNGRPLYWSEALITAWCGMRGVATIVTALALPYATSTGDPFPGRDQILFVAMVTVVLTLLLQGLTLPWLIARMGLREDAEKEAAATRKVLDVVERAAYARLDERLDGMNVPPEFAQRMRDRVAMLFDDLDDQVDGDEESERRRFLAWRTKLRDTERDMLSAARGALLQARLQRGYDPVIIDQMLMKLDVRSAALDQ